MASLTRWLARRFRGLADRLDPLPVALPDDDPRPLRLTVTVLRPDGFPVEVLSDHPASTFGEDGALVVLSGPDAFGLSSRMVAATMGGRRGVPSRN
jgi:hypothetical protein